MTQNNRNQSQISQTKRFEQIVSVLHKYDAIGKMTPVKLRMILEELGPTYIKLGQIMSSRSDLLPSAYTHELQKLRSNVSPMDEQTVCAQIEQAFHQKPEELFLSFNPVPVGSASMAQVHEAVTKEGNQVIVKIQRPEIYEQMAVDVKIMRKAGKLLSLDKVISSVVNINDVIDEFWASAKEEMDFRHEASNAILFAQNNSQETYIHVPKIYEEYTRQNILVMEDIRGVAIDQYDKLAAQGYDRHEIAMKLGVNFMKQVVQDGFFHADPHSGNIKIWYGRICWLDFGMMGELSQSEAALMKKALQAMAQKDNSALTDCVLAIGIPPAQLDYSGFYNALDSFMNRYVQVNFADMDVAIMAEEVMEICHTYRIQLPKGITMLLRSMVTIQGTLKDLDPGVNIVEFVAQEKMSVEDVDWEKEFKKLAVQFYQSSHALLQMPQDTENILQQVKRGQLKLNLHVSDLDTLLPNVDRMVDRIVICVLIAALLMGSSIVCTTDLKPTFLDIPLLGFAGFMVSFCLSLWLFYKMLFKQKKNDKLF